MYQMEPTKEEKTKEEKTKEEKTKEEKTKEEKTKVMVKEIKTVRRCLIEKGMNCTDGVYIRGKDIVFYDGSLFKYAEYSPTGIFFPMLAIGMDGRISETDISEIVDTIEEYRGTRRDTSCIIYNINHTFDAFGKINIFGDPPKKISLIGNETRIFSEEFSDKMFLKKEPIMLCALQREELKLILEYNKLPELSPRILCDIWTLGDRNKQQFQDIVYSEEYDFYYENGSISKSLKS